MWIDQLTLRRPCTFIVGAPGRDFGSELEVLAGLTVDDALVVNPGDDVPHGAMVRVAQPTAAADRAVKR